MKSFSSYICFHYYTQKVCSTLQFSFFSFTFCFLGDPLLYHGSHIITICNPTDLFCNSQLLAKLRIANGLKKILVLAAVSNIEMFTRKFTVQRIKHCEIKNDNDDDDNDGSVVDPPVIVSEHSKLSVQSKEITSDESTHSNCNSSTNKIQPNVIYLSLQYMSSHSSNPTFSKSLWCIIKIVFPFLSIVQYIFCKWEWLKEDKYIFS